MTTPVASLPVAVPTMTLGRAWVHDLDVKMAEAKNAGYQGLEVFWEDLVYAAKKINPTSTEKDEATMLQAARYAKELCDKNGLVVMALQPFLNYDGLLDETKHQENITKLKLWFKVAKILGTDLIQVPSQMNLEGTTGNFDKLVADIREIGELGLKEDPPVRFAYEALAWGAHLDLWQQVWAVVTEVDLPNVGTVLDTYQILGRIYGDPTSPTGKQTDAEEALAASLKEMVAAAPALLPKLFYVQLSDAEFIYPPLTPTHPFYDPAQKPQMMWSRNARLFPCESDRGGYLPVDKVAKVLFEDIGYRGWISMEVFSRTMSEPGKEVPREHAQRGMKSWKAFLTQLGYNTNDD
ncbi:sugar phosphate isomerase [Armillaria gallica]|uniref:Sugar phosphate isomerase n=1 Tax=Armillaria gallica TaxID=47427 RepID=A0A2H3EL62_ARMGA|nr:sugar phosphate isomerase [Armillaria gallica]